MPLEFKSERLQIDLIQSASEVSADAIIDILSGEATAHLPRSWQNVSTHATAAGWTQDRLKEGETYSLTLRGSREHVGFLFLHGLNNRAQQQVRIGYVFAERYWGKGLATDLIRSVICASREAGTVSTICAGVEKENIASVKVLTKNKFAFSDSVSGTDFYLYKF